jgi:hypothetical protein
MESIRAGMTVKCKLARVDEIARNLKIEIGSVGKSSHESRGI